MDAGKARRPSGRGVRWAVWTLAVAVLLSALAAEARALPSEVTKPRWDVGEVFRDCPGCPEMVVVPGGQFGRPFAVGVYEVTFGEWDACVSDGRCGGYRPTDNGWGRGRRPVIHLFNWEFAQDYVRWLSGKTGEAYRLLSESEWEYVARAGTRTAYWWGDEIGWNRASCRGCGSRWDGHRTAPVGSFHANGYKLHDVLGNVWEWVEDCWNGSYRGAPSDGSAWISGECGQRVRRGGSWHSPWFFRSATRDRRSAGYRVINVGFRVARTLTPPPPGDAARAYEVAAERLSRSQRAARRRWNRAGGIYAAAVTVAVSVPWEGRMVTVAATCGLRRPEDRDCPIHGIPTPAPTDSAAISR